MKKKLFIVLGALFLSISLLFFYIVKDNKEENNKEISKVEKSLSKPEGIQAYTLNGENTNISYNDLIEGYEIDSITCKNGTIATYNQSDNTVTMTNVHVPEYCVMNFKPGTYTVTIDAGGGYFGNPTEIDDGYNDVVVLQKGVSVPVATGNTLNLTPNQKYMLSFDYWSDEGSVEFDVDLFPDSLPQIYPVATTTWQTMNWIFSSSSSDMNSCQIRYFNDRKVPNPQQIAIINKHLYKCDDCTLTYTKDVTKGDAYGTLNTPKRYGWDFLGWYLEDGTKVESTSINKIKGNHKITAKWSHHNYEVKLVGVNGTIEYAPMWYYTAGWEKAFTKLTANNGYTTNGATVSCTGSAGASISGDYLYLSNITEDQTCTVTFKPSTLLGKLLADNPTIKTRTNFNTTFTTTNTGTLYKSTESIAGSPAKDVYYFAGNAKNNWVKFGKYPLDRVVYRGYYSEGNNSYLEYSTMDACTSATRYNTNCTEIKFANAGDPMYWRIIRTNYDGSVRLLYAGTSPDTTEGYIGESAFNSTYDNSSHVGYMYTPRGSQTSISNTIKTYIDNWYSTNLSSYSKYISTEAVYCNDRRATLNSDEFALYHGASIRLMNNKTPTYNCAVKEDSFSSSTSGGGNGMLTYPIGLMTADEIAYAGGEYRASLPSPYAWYYLNSNGESVTGKDWWWLMSPFRFEDKSGAWVFFIHDNLQGKLLALSVNDQKGVRPAISIKSCALWSSGNGSSSSPYEINGGC